MESPLQLELHGVRASDHVRELVEKNLSKIEKRYGRATACRVVVRAPNAHHKHGEPFEVSVRVALPAHREINVGHTTSDDDRLASDNRNLIAPQQPHNACRRCRSICRLIHRHPPEAMRGHAIHIFFESDPVEARPLVNLFRHRMLQQNPPHLRIRIQLIDRRQQLFRRGRPRQCHAQRSHTHPPARIALHAHVRRRCGIVAHQNRRQYRGILQIQPLHPRR